MDFLAQDTSCPRPDLALTTRKTLESTTPPYTTMNATIRPLSWIRLQRRETPEDREERLARQEYMIAHQMRSLGMF